MLCFCLSCARFTSYPSACNVRRCCYNTWRCLSIRYRSKIHRAARLRHPAAQRDRALNRAAMFEQVLAQTHRHARIRRLRMSCKWACRTLPYTAKSTGASAHPASLVHHEPSRLKRFPRQRARSNAPRRAAQRMGDAFPGRSAWNTCDPYFQKWRPTSSCNWARGPLNGEFSI